MSRHPGNPYWHQEHDGPITIYRQDWDEAVSNGWVTDEHILERLQGIVQHAYGIQDGDAIAYDDEGFVSVLTAEGLRMKDGVELRINPDDHWPRHAHVVVPGHRGKLTINLDTFSIDQDLPDGWSRRGRAIEKFARDNATKLLEWWVKYRGTERPVGR